MHHTPDLIFSPKSVVYQAIADFNAQREAFEKVEGLVQLSDFMENLISPSVVSSSIDEYRRVIRGNDWFFPNSPNRRTSGLLSDWRDVHVEYFEHACKIYSTARKQGLDELARYDIYRETVASETMRGWVGKRSRTGPDELIERLTDEVERLLREAGESDEIIDQVLHLGGLYHGDSLLLSAEEELRVLFRAYVSSGSQSLNAANIEDADALTRGGASRLLRDFTKYSISDFNTKLADLAQSDSEERSRSRGDAALSKARHTLDSALRGIPDVFLRARLSELLSEVRMLNFLNLNLEVKYSFKGWAGVMHGLVFSAVSKQPWASLNVYRNLEYLKEN